MGNASSRLPSIYAYANSARTSFCTSGSRSSLNLRERITTELTERHCVWEHCNSNAKSLWARCRCHEYRPQHIRFVGIRLLGSRFKAHGIPTDPEDRKIQNDSWLRYIGNSIARLAHAFRDFFLPIAAYSEDPALLVQNRISLDDLKRLYEELPPDSTLTDRDQKSLEILRRFLDCAYRKVYPARMLLKSATSKKE